MLHEARASPLAATSTRIGASVSWRRCSATAPSLVFDERLFMKCYRVLEAAERAESSVLFGLDAVGFNAIISPVARWSDGGVDLALIREFLPSALEGRLLALTSLRDLLAYVNETEDEAGFRPIAAGSSADEVAASAGGDIAFEMRRLGQTAARLHVALAEAFGDVALAPRYDLLTSSAEAPPDEAWGREIRLHGDFHLRRVMRTDGGWIISGFGDDPLFAAATASGSVAARSGSPLEDVADMFFCRCAKSRNRRRSACAHQLNSPMRRRSRTPGRAATSSRSCVAISRSTRSRACCRANERDPNPASSPRRVAFARNERSASWTQPPRTLARPPRSSSAACSGLITLMYTPVPSSNPARVVILGRMCACQWNGAVARYGAAWNTTL